MSSRAAQTARDLTDPLQTNGRPDPPNSDSSFARVCFSFAPPSFDLLFAIKSVPSSRESFVINQAIYFILFGKTAHGAVLMFPKAPLKIVGDTSVKNDSASIGHHIYEEIFH